MVRAVTVLKMMTMKRKMTAVRRISVLTLPATIARMVLTICHILVMVARTMREGASTLPWLPAYYVSLSLDDSSFCHEHSVASMLGLVAAVSFVLALVSKSHMLSLMHWRGPSRGGRRTCHFPQLG